MKNKTFWKLTGLCLAAFTAVGLMITGCATTSKQAGNAKAVAQKTDSAKSGAQLWAENCQRCHNFRSPASFSDAQWEVAAMHMRVRANLTAEEHRKIIEFLKAGN
jgi:mono/diheme cytochrome c family protein